MIVPRCKRSTFLPRPFMATLWTRQGPASHDCSTPKLSSIFAGYVLSTNPVIFLVRTAFYVGLISLFCIACCRLPPYPSPCPFTPALTVGISALIFSIQFVIYAANRVIDHLPSPPVDSKQTPSPVAQQTSGVYSRRRFSGRAQTGASGETAVHQGLTTREKISAFFGTDYSILYVVVSSTLIGATVCIFIPILQIVGMPAAVYLGMACYSVLAPPEVEVYSTIHRDNFTGITRPFTLFLIGALWKIVCGLERRSVRSEN
jgi:hypothetical protein